MIFLDIVDEIGRVLKAGKFLIRIKQKTRGQGWSVLEGAVKFTVSVQFRLCLGKDMGLSFGRHICVVGLE